MITRRYRWAVASRCVAAIGGGYALTGLATVLLADVLPLPPADAALCATMISFALYAGVIVWAFAASELRRVWAGVSGASAALALLLLVLHTGGTA